MKEPCNYQASSSGTQGNCSNDCSGRAVGDGITSAFNVTLWGQTISLQGARCQDRRGLGLQEGSGGAAGKGPGLRPPNPTQRPRAASESWSNLGWMDLLRSAPAPLVTPLINALTSNAWISDLTSWGLGIIAEAQLHLLGHNLQRARGRAHPGARVPEEGTGA